MCQIDLLHLSITQSLGIFLLVKRLLFLVFRDLVARHQESFLARAYFLLSSLRKFVTPSFDDILSLGPLAMGNEKGRVELARYAIVPPVLIEALCMDELVPALVLGKSIELLETSRDSIDLIFRNIIKSDLKKNNVDQDQPLSDEEIESQIMAEKIGEFYKLSFSTFFTFLWSTLVPTLIEKFPPTFGPLLQKPSILSRAKELHSNCLCSVAELKDSSFLIESA